MVAKKKMQPEKVLARVCVWGTPAGWQEYKRRKALIGPCAAFLGMHEEANAAAAAAEAASPPKNKRKAMKVAFHWVKAHAEAPKKAKAAAMQRATAMAVEQARARSIDQLGKIDPA